jgi:hypothetical protein
MNLKKVQIPEVLLSAMARPYDVANLNRCGAVAAEVARLDAALGPDRDAAPSDGHRDAGSTAAGLMRGGAESVIPYRGLLRRLTGAASYQARVQDAVLAGAARRGYLKGLGMRMNCAPPAAPSWFRPAPPPPKPVVFRAPVRPSVQAPAPRPPAPRPAARSRPAPRALVIPLPSWWPGR